MSWYPPYVPVAERRRKAQKQIEKLKKNGKTVQPVIIEGRTIAKTFWGKAWCTNLESYSDYSNRLPRGRTYVRNGSVMDLQVEPGKITALVAGSSMYKVDITITKVAYEKWNTIVSDCAGKIDSLIELLQGRFSKAVMEIITNPGKGLFPHPSEIKLNCSCPDWADMCKHVAAALYGVGARLDHNPEALFLLRQADHVELISVAGTASIANTTTDASDNILADTDLSSLFGIDMENNAEKQMPTDVVNQDNKSSEVVLLKENKKSVTRIAKNKVSKKTKKKIVKTVVKKTIKPKKTTLKKTVKKVIVKKSTAAGFKKKTKNAKNAKNIVKNLDVKKSTTVIKNIKSSVKKTPKQRVKKIAG